MPLQFNEPITFIIEPFLPDPFPKISRVAITRGYLESPVFIRCSLKVKTSNIQVNFEQNQN